MKPHKWAKEIKAWADGVEIEVKDGKSSWWVTPSPEWVVNNSVEYRIKPQPKEPQYLYVYNSGFEFQLSCTKSDNQMFVSGDRMIPFKYMGKMEIEVDYEV